MSHRGCRLVVLFFLARGHQKTVRQHRTAAHLQVCQALNHHLVTRSSAAMRKQKMGFPESWGHPCSSIDGIFPHKNQPFMDTPMTMESPKWSFHVVAKVPGRRPPRGSWLWNLSQRTRHSPGQRPSLDRNHMEINL